MSNLVRTPIVDSTGKQTHVWRGTGVDASNSRVASTTGPVRSTAATVKPWEELTLDEKMDKVEFMVHNTLSENSLGNEGWTVAFSRSYRVLGSCNATRKIITVSKKLIEYEDFDEVEDTVLHEVAHALADPSVGHGPQWKAIAARIGARPERAAVAAKVPAAPGRKKAVTKTVVDYVDGVRVETKVEVPVYLGDYIRAFEGVDMKITKINSKTVMAMDDTGQMYQIRAVNAEKYKDDYTLSHKDD
jgi:hypothetical protein